MPRTSEITSANSNVLLIGDSGSKKTRTLASVPGIYIFDCDMGLASARDLDAEYDTYKDLGAQFDHVQKRWVRIPGGPVLQAQGLYEFGTAWDAIWRKVMWLNNEFAAGRGPKAIGLDSLTHLSILAIDKILWDTNQPSSHQGTWGAHHEYFKQLFGMMTAWPCRFIATAHIDRNTNDLTKVTELLPLLAGKLAALCSTFFDEVYFCDVDSNVKPPRYYITTQLTTEKRQAKTRWNVPNGTPTDWAEIAKYLPTEPGIFLPPATPVLSGSAPSGPVKVVSSPAPAAMKF